MVARSARQVCKSAVCAARNGKYTKAVARSDVRYGDAQQRTAGRARGQGISAVSFPNSVVLTTEFDLLRTKIPLLCCGKPHTAAAKVLLCAARKHDELTVQLRHTAARQLHKRCAVLREAAAYRTFFKKRYHALPATVAPLLPSPAFTAELRPSRRTLSFPQAARFRRAVPFSQTVPFPQTIPFPEPRPSAKKNPPRSSRECPFFFLRP